MQSMAFRRFLAAFSVCTLVLFVIHTSRINPADFAGSGKDGKSLKLKRTTSDWFQCCRSALRSIREDAEEPMAASNVVTLGIGQDVKAEIKMKEILANGSHFYGADPVYEGNGKLFEAVGDFFPFAVGTQIDVSRAYVLMNGRYQTLLMPHIDIITFLKKYVKQDFIDQLLMDNEGPEYEIIPMMGRGREFDANELVVCQCNTEIHRPDNEKKEKFRKIMNQMMEDERYMILDFYSTNVHHRLFFVNVEHPYCLNRYIAQFYE